MFCVECGKEELIYKNGVCIPCYLKHTQFTKGPSILDITHCPHCSAFKYKNTWIQDSFDNVLQRHVKDAFHISNELENIGIQHECKEHDRILECMITITGTLTGHQVVERHPLTVRIKKTTCDVCSREAGGYYEAILQIRADERLLSKQELATLTAAVKTMVGQLQEGGKRGLFITDMEEKREGLDFFLSDKGTALMIAKKIQEQFGGEFKQSASNVGMKDSRQLYRMTYLVRLPSYRTGDFFASKKSHYQILSLHGTKVRAVDLSTWEELVFEVKDMHGMKILGGPDLVKEMMVVSQSKTDVQLMDTKTYHTVEIRKPIKGDITTSTVKTVRLTDQLFLLP